MNKESVYISENSAPLRSTGNRGSPKNRTGEVDSVIDTYGMHMDVKYTVFPK